MDIGFKFSKKYCCRTYPKSGLSLLPKFLSGGVIDSDYRGNISVILTNFSSSDYNLNLGDKIAQIMFIRPVPVSFEEVQEFSDFFYSVLESKKCLLCTFKTKNSNATPAEKKELVSNLLEKQKSLAEFLIRSYPADIDLRICLMFVCMICSSKFGDYFFQLIPNSYP